MSAEPVRYETNISVNERFVAYLDREYAPRDSRRWYGMLALTANSLTAAVLLVLVLLRNLNTVWPLAPVAILVLIALSIGLAARGMRCLRQMKQARDRFQDLRRVVQNGVPVTAYVVQAHASLLQPGGQTLPCVVLFSFQPEVDGDREYMRHLADRIYALKGQSHDDADQRFLAGLTSEDCAFYRRRRLPNSFTDGSTIYCADLWVKSSYLKDQSLKTNVLTCLAEMGEYGGIELVPAWLADPAELPVKTDSPVF